MFLLIVNDGLLSLLTTYQRIDSELRSQYISYQTTTSPLCFQCYCKSTSAHLLASSASFQRRSLQNALRRNQKVPI